MSLEEKYKPTYCSSDLLFFKNYPCVKRHCCVEKAGFAKRYPNKSKYQLIVLPQWLYSHFLSLPAKGPYAIHLSHLSPRLQQQILSEKCVPQSEVPFSAIKSKKNSKRQKQYYIEVKYIESFYFDDLKALICAQKQSETSDFSEITINDIEFNMIKNSTKDIDIDKQLYEELNEFVNIQNDIQSSSTSWANTSSKTNETNLQIINLSLPVIEESESTVLNFETRTSTSSLATTDVVALSSNAISDIEVGLQTALELPLTQNASLTTSLSSASSTSISLTRAKSEYGNKIHVIFTFS